jgi:membrane protein CcdC involved in cytochrome C biogenesis
LALNRLQYSWRAEKGEKIILKSLKAFDVISVDFLVHFVCKLTVSNLIKLTDNGRRWGWGRWL